LDEFGFGGWGSPALVGDAKRMRPVAASRNPSITTAVEQSE
jgi:hypothetical protein